MVRDPLTKKTGPERLVNTMTTGRLDLKPTAESLMVKNKNRELRRKVRASAGAWNVSPGRSPVGDEKEKRKE